MKIKKLLAAVLVFALCAAFFAACAKTMSPLTASTASEPTTETYESVKMNIGCISGPTGIGMAYLMGQSDEKKTANEYTFSVATSPRRNSFQVCKRRNEHCVRSHKPCGKTFTQN